VDNRIIIDLNPPITVGIKSAERFRQRLDHDTGADKAVECDTWRRATGRRGRGFAIIFALDEVEELGVEGVPELGHSLGEFYSVDGAGVVSVKVFKDTLPILNITPETRKLAEANGPLIGRPKMPLGRTSSAPVAAKPLLLSAAESNAWFDRFDRDLESITLSVTELALDNFEQTNF